jgi:hypothetical protein
MKKRLGIALGLLIAVGIFFFFSWINMVRDAYSARDSATNQSLAPLASSTNTGSNGLKMNSPVDQTQPASLASKAGRRVPPSTAVADLPQQTVLQNVRRAVHQYGVMFGGNPVGTNPEITSQLSGDNPKHINFLSGEAGMRVNADGELVDSWGTPYFFHQLSASDMEIHSAGPDKIMWTSDDLVVK